MQRVQTTLAVLILAAGCGGSGTESNPDPDPIEQSTNGSETTETPDVVPSPPEPWESMSTEAKQQWMVNEVQPRMTALFEEFDAERYSGFSCDGCHGEDMQARNFEMPNPNIMVLHPSGTPEQEQMVADHPEMVRFMFQKVLPTMQTLLGAEAFNDETQEGFSCFACHTAAAADPAAK